MHVLHYIACMLHTSGPFAVFHHPLLASTLTELGLLPLQVFWWCQTLHFWNSLVVLPAGSLYHTVCLDNHDKLAFRGVLAPWLACWQHVCIQWVF